MSVPFVLFLMLTLQKSFLRYLIGRQLVNYGTAATEEFTPMAVPVEETGHD